MRLVVGCVAVLGLTAGFLTGALSAAPPDAASSDIVVTAQSLTDTQNALRDCIARHCPPSEDIRASLVHAENQYVAGAYADARQTVSASLRRNRRQPGASATDVASLFRVHSRLSAHLGQETQQRRSLVDMRETLRDALGDADPQTLAARIEVADGLAAMGIMSNARRAYMDVAADADRLSLPRIAAFTRIRLANLVMANADADSSSADVRMARAQLEAIAANGAAAGQDMALVAAVLMYRFDKSRGDETGLQQVIARYAAMTGVTAPVLMWSEPIQLPSTITDAPRDNAGVTHSNQYNSGAWIDVGFWIEPDGKVSNVEVLRQSTRQASWSSAVERAIQTRRYIPTRGQNGAFSPGQYQIERYTLTADSSLCIASHLQCHNGTPRVQQMNLTPDLPPPTIGS